MKNFVGTLSVVLLSIGAYVLASIILMQKGFIYTKNNLEISVLISIMFGIGTFLLLLMLWKLANESRQVGKVVRQELQAKDDVEAIASELTESWMWERVASAVTLHRLNSEIDGAKLSNMLRNKVSNSGSVVRFIASSIVFVGLLGTFLGIIQSAQGFDAAFNQATTITPYENISKIIGGLDKALGTSIVGIIASVILSFMLVIVKNFQHHIINRLEAVSLTKVLPFFQKAPDQNLAEAITTSIERTLPKVMKGATGDLQTAAENLKYSTESLLDTQKRINSLVSNISTTILQLDSASDRFGSSLAHFSDDFQVLRKTLQSLQSELIHNRSAFETVAKMNQMSKDGLQRIGDRVQLSNQQLLEYINVKEKLVENLLVDFNTTMTKLQQKIGA